MKLKVAHFDEQVFEDKLQHLSHLDFSLFIETAPQSQDELSDINIISFQEPNEYFGLHDWVIKNQHIFSVILTQNDKVLNNCDNATYQPFGHTWLKPDQYNKDHDKKFQLSHLCGKLNKTYGHSLRHETLARQNEFSIPLNFYDIYGDRSNIEDARLGKEFIFGDSQFGVVIENTSYRGYFTEKILDCFLLKTIPIYWGCSNIGDYFDIDGIITVNNVDDLIYKTNQLNESYYENRKEIIDKNWKLALDYVDYQQNIVNTITNIFKHNKLI
jgi:hypothetical protein